MTRLNKSAWVVLVGLAGAAALWWVALVWMGATNHDAGPLSTSDTDQNRSAAGAAAQLVPHLPDTGGTVQSVDNKRQTDASTTPQPTIEGNNLATGGVEKTAATVKPQPSAEPVAVPESTAQQPVLRSNRAQATIVAPTAQTQSTDSAATIDRGQAVNGSGSSPLSETSDTRVSGSTSGDNTLPSRTDTSTEPDGDPFGSSEPGLTSPFGGGTELDSNRSVFAPPPPPG